MITSAAEIISHPLTALLQIVTAAHARMLMQKIKKERIYESFDAKPGFQKVTPVESCFIC